MNIPKVWTEPFADFLHTEFGLGRAVGGDSADYFNNKLRAEAAKKFRIHQLPSELKTWEANRKKLMAMLWKKSGVSINHELALDYQETGSIKMDGYTVKNIYYQSRPGIYVTGNLYIPDGKKPFPAVVNMHGHWQQGRLAERVQARGHSLAKNGYVCISVDAFGSGERSTEHGNFEYHGGNLGCSLMNIGETLLGAQLVDNMRAVDLLCSFDFVDKKKIGATGASGGGNQTMWLTALDERIAAAVPVVSVGTFESYVTRYNCICELLPDGLTFTEESGILALTAPRALKICNCLHDCNPTFHVTEMLRSFNEAQKIYKALDAYDKFTYQAFNQPHGYWPEIREAMLGWFDLHLKGIGNGMPKQEIPFETLPEEKLMVFKKGKRPANVIGIAEYCRRKGIEMRRDFHGTKSFDKKRKAEELKQILRITKWLELENVHEYSQEGIWKKFALETSDGGMIPVLVAKPENKTTEFIIFVHPQGKDKIQDKAVRAAMKQKKGVILADLWASGETHQELVPSYGCTARAALWLGKSMQGEWAKQTAVLCDFAAKKIKARKISIHAYRETAVSTLLLNAMKKLSGELILEEAPLSYLFNKATQSDFFTMAVHLPEIMKWGDISLAAAMTDANISFVDPVLSDGEKINEEKRREWKKEFALLVSKCKSKTKITLD